MLAKTVLLLILLIPAIPAVAEDAAKYPLRVQLRKNHLAHDRVATEIKKPLGTDQEAPTRWEVRTFGIAVIEDKDYNVTCEGHRGLGAGQYNARWEKNGTLTLLAPRTATARLLQVTCKTWPRK